MNIVEISEKLDRDKVLDEAIFLALCGLSHCREWHEITGVVRLKMAKYKLESVINKIHEKMDKR